jgi:hypothetical protein
VKTRPIKPISIELRADPDAPAADLAGVLATLILARARKAVRDTCQFGTTSDTSGSNLPPAKEGAA